MPYKQEVLPSKLGLSGSKHARRIILVSWRVSLSSPPFGVGVSFGAVVEVERPPSRDAARIEPIHRDGGTDDRGGGAVAVGGRAHIV